ncbi:MAG: phosphosulfolactate synthase [Vulcanimicrobiaceae bacterium]
MSDLAWSGVIDHVWNGDVDRGRRNGITMMLDTGLGLAATEDYLETAGPYVDHWKFGFGTSALVPARLLGRKLEAIARHGILAYPGGTLLEAATVQHHCRIYMERSRELGFRGVEISDGTIDLPPQRRRNMIACALRAGLVPITEVGKKDPHAQPNARELAELALQDLEWGAEFVTIEARESGIGIGIFDELGKVRAEMVEEIAAIVGGDLNRLIWEAPLKAQQAALVARFGAAVSLGNVLPDNVLALQALRIGLRFETLSRIAAERRVHADWNPDDVEPALPRVVSAAAKQTWSSA